MKILARLSIPGRLKDGMLLKEGEYFDVPHTHDGIDFMRWWEQAKKDDRDALMKQAYASGANIVETFKAKLESECA